LRTRDETRGEERRGEEKRGEEMHSDEDQELLMLMQAKDNESDAVATRMGWQR